jgi:hypothetical protein
VVIASATWRPTPVSLRESHFEKDTIPDMERPVNHNCCSVFLAVCLGNEAKGANAVVRQQGRQSRKQVRRLIT